MELVSRIQWAIDRAKMKDNQGLGWRQQSGDQPIDSWNVAVKIIPKKGSEIRPVAQWIGGQSLYNSVTSNQFFEV